MCRTYKKRAKRTRHVRESAYEAQQKLNQQACKKATFEVDMDQAAFLVDTYGEVQKGMIDSPPGTRPSDLVENLRNKRKRERTSGHPSIERVYFEETMVATNDHSPLWLGQMKPHFGHGAFAFNKPFAVAVRKQAIAEHYPNKDWQPQLPDVPEGRLSYTEHQLKKPTLVSLYRYLKNEPETPGRLPRKYSPKVDIGRFDAVILSPDERSFTQVDDKFESASNNQDRFSPEQARRYARIVNKGGGLNAADPSALMQISQFDFTPHFDLDKVRTLNAIRTRNTPTTRMQDRKFDAWSKGNTEKYGDYKRTREDDDDGNTRRFKQARKDS